MSASIFSSLLASQKPVNIRPESLAEIPQDIIKGQPGLDHDLEDINPISEVYFALYRLLSYTKICLTYYLIRYFDRKNIGL